MPKKPALKIVESNLTGRLPPRKLGEHGERLWRDVTRAYHIEDVGGLELLAQACAAADRAAALTAAIAADGETIQGENGPRAHPCLQHELSARSFVVRTLARLGILHESAKPMGRPAEGFGWQQKE